MTTLQEALSEFGMDRLHAVAASALAGRDKAAAAGDHQWSGLMNAILCGAVDEQAVRGRAADGLFDALELAASPVRVVGVERPGD